MSDTYKDMKHNLDKNKMSKRKSWGYEYWGRDAPHDLNLKEQLFKQSNSLPAVFLTDRYGWVHPKTIMSGEFADDCHCH